MQILKPHDKYNWITAIIAGRWCQAKVYNEPSTFGINYGRVSKLAISKTDKRNENEEFFPQMCFNYDRGLDFDRTPPGLLDEIVAELENLPELPCQD